MSGLIGKRLGGYRIEAELGKGGMGIVYRATQIELDRPVAIKLLPPQFTIDPAFIQRFRREARAIAQLNHPNIVQIYDIGVEQSTHFYAMELVEGETVDDRIFRQYRLPVPDAVRIIVHVCRGLQAAHDAGIVHRDIKPANIILDSRNQAKLMDFGIALAQGTERLTSTGGIIGTPEYMSPEQASGQAVTAQSDIYSLGIVFYEMLTGVVPFENEQSMVTLQQQQFEEPKPPGQINKAVPLAVEQILLKMLAKNPADRYATCTDIITDLRAVVKGATSGSSATGVVNTGAQGMLPYGARRTGRWWGIAATAAFLVAAAGFVLVLRRPAVPPGRDLPVEEPAVRYAADAEVLAGLLGVYDAYAARQAAGERVRLRLVNGGEVAAADVQLDEAVVILTVSGLGTVRLPRSVLDPTAPVTYDDAPRTDALASRAGRDWARDVYETWKLEHHVDRITPEDLATLQDAAVTHLPPAPPIPFAEALRLLVERSAELTAAEAALAALEAEQAQLRVQAPNSADQYPDRVVLRTSGREVRCRILEAESDVDTLQLELPTGGKMRVAFADVRHYQRAYGQDAAAAADARTRARDYRGEAAELKARIAEQRQAVAESTVRHADAVARLLDATALPADEPAAADAFATLVSADTPLEPPGAGPAPGPSLWQESFTAAEFVNDEWQGWRLARECGDITARFAGGALELSTDAAPRATGCPPHVTRGALSIRGAGALDLAMRIDTPIDRDLGLLASWIEIEAPDRRPLAYLLYGSSPAAAALPAGQAEPTVLIVRDDLLVPADGAWHTRHLPLAEDWAGGDGEELVITGVRLVHYREGPELGRFTTAFGRIGIPAESSGP